MGVKEIRWRRQAENEQRFRLFLMEQEMKTIN
jgi:hypothetical protein